MPLTKRCMIFWRRGTDVCQILSRHIFSWSTDKFLLKFSSCSPQSHSQASRKYAPSTNLARKNPCGLKIFIRVGAHPALRGRVKRKKFLGRRGCLGWCGCSSWRSDFFFFLRQFFFFGFLHFFFDRPLFGQDINFFAGNYFLFN